MKVNIQNKTALITGATGLLGIEHAEALLQVNADVVLTDIDEKKLVELQKYFAQKYPERKISQLYMDVSSEESVFQVVNSLKSAGQAVDILVNNAAIDPKVSKTSELLEHSRLENFSLESWNKQVSVGLTGAFLCAKHFGTWMVERKAKGIILNIASDLSVFAPDQRLYRKPGLSEDRQPVKPVTYSVIKTGLIGLTRYLAGYWADQGIRVNALSPGGVFNGQPQEFVDKLTQLIPLGRMANKDEYHGCVQFLCSEASSYLTGQNIVSDGGRSIL